METTTTRPKALPPAPPPKPKNKVNGNGSHHQQTSDEEHANNNVDNFYGNNGNHHSNNSLNNNSHHYYPSTPPSDEQVVMTPRGKTSNSTVILIERKLVEQVGDRVHVAGGDHQGIIINKDVVKGERFSVEILLCNSQCKIHFSRSKVRQDALTSHPGVPSVSQECKDRPAHARVKNTSILVPRLVDRW